jgi:hypothetical protein
MRRGLTLLLCAYLLVWVPLGFAGELFASASTLGMRGAPAIVELSAHGAVAMFCATAGYMLLNGAPAARSAATAAVIVAALVAIQSIYWTVLPRQLAPGESLPMLAVVLASTGCWLAIIWARGARDPLSKGETSGA